MVGASKILTVSYGTFSCTLEGFDDPFSTMRSIAEYFRDLAADDRYFGAEPPTPDAEMLHRIAEKEVQRRVETRVQDNGIVLKQLDADEPKVEDAPAEETSLAAVAAEYEEEADAADDNLPSAAEVAELAPAPDTGPSESVAEKLSRIRAVVDNVRAEETRADHEQSFVAAEDVSDTDTDEDAGFDDDATEDDIAEALSAFDEDDDAAEEATIHDEVESVGETEEADAVEAAVETDVAVDEEPVADVTAEEAEVLAEEDTADHQDDAAEFETVAAATDDAEEDSFADTDEDDTPMMSEEDDMASDEAGDEHYDAPLVAEMDGAEPSDDDAEDMATAEPMGRVVVLPRDEFEAEQDAWDDTDDAGDEPSQTASDDDWGGFDVEDDSDGETPVAAEAEDQAEDEAEDDHEDMAAEAEHEADDDLAAGIRAAIGQHDADDEIAYDDPVEMPDTDMHDPDEDRHVAFADLNEESAGETAARDRLGDLAEPEEGATDVDRLLEKTNNQMQESEGSRRRSAIAHLKAAVAATKADRLLKRVTSREASEAEEQTQYRDDLAQVVRPRRPSADHPDATSERPKAIAEAASPLMLVSELRVDEEGHATGATAIRPRRIRADEEADAAADDASSGYEDAASFAKFAEEMGAKELPDLLEAAAAFAAFVENRPHFSRPQLMKRVAKHDASGEFSREAGLRSFGQLLRQGKIRKLKRGQFTVADSTRFNPEARIAGE